MGARRTRTARATPPAAAAVDDDVRRGSRATGDGTDVGDAARRPRMSSARRGWGTGAMRPPDGTPRADAGGDVAPGRRVRTRAFRTRRFRTRRTPEGDRARGRPRSAMWHRRMRRCATADDHRRARSGCPPPRATQPVGTVRRDVRHRAGARADRGRVGEETAVAHPLPPTVPAVRCDGRRTRVADVEWVRRGVRDTIFAPRPPNFFPTRRVPLAHTAFVQAGGGIPCFAKHSRQSKPKARNPVVPHHSGLQWMPCRLFA